MRISNWPTTVTKIAKYSNGSDLKYEYLWETKVYLSSKYSYVCMYIVHIIMSLYLQRINTYMYLLCVPIIPILRTTKTQQIAHIRVYVLGYFANSFASHIPPPFTHWSRYHTRTIMHGNFFALILVIITPSSTTRRAVVERIILHRISSFLFNLMNREFDFTDSKMINFVDDLEP